MRKLRTYTGLIPYTGMLTAGRWGGDRSATQLAGTLEEARAFSKLGVTARWPSAGPRLGSMALAFILIGCGGGGGDGNNGEVQGPTTEAPSNAQAYLEAVKDNGISISRELGEERALLLTDKATGEQISILGGRDADGRLVNVTEIQSTDSQGRTTAVDYLNETDRRITVNDQTSILMSKQPDGNWLIEYLDRQTGTTLKTNISANAIPSPSNPSATTEPTESKAARGTREFAKLLRSQKLGVQSGQGTASTINQIPVTVTSRSCGKVTDVLGAVKLTLNGGSGQYQGTYSTKKTGAGTYVGYIPDTAKLSSVSLETVKDALQSTAEAMDIACAADAASPMASTYLCLSTSTAIAQSTLGVGTPLAAKFLAACEAAVVASKVACRVKQAIPALPVPDNVDPNFAGLIPSLEGILIKMIPDSVFNSQVTPYIDALPSPIHGQSVAITAGTSSVSATITDDSVKVGELLLSPSSPAAGQSYVASTDLQCIPFDSNVSIQVVGTDGYTDSNSKTYPQTIAADTISLQVPGGASGVRDTVTLQVNPRNSAPTTRTAYLVFQ